MTIIAGIFNLYDFENLNKITYITHISCLFSAFLLIENKNELCQVYQNKEIIYISYTLMVFSTLNFIRKVNKATINLKLINAENYIILIDNGLITPSDAIKQLKYNDNITNQVRFEIIEAIENKYKDKY